MSTTSLGPEHRPEESATRKAFKTYDLVLRDDVSEERKKVAEQVSELASLELFLWDNFPIHLPPSTLLDDSSAHRASEAARRSRRNKKKRDKKKEKKAKKKEGEYVSIDDRDDGKDEVSPILVPSLIDQPLEARGTVATTAITLDNGMQVEHELSSSSSSSSDLNASGFPTPLATSTRSEPDKFSGVLIEQELSDEDVNLVARSRNEDLQFEDNDANSSDDDDNKDGGVIGGEYNDDDDDETSSSDEEGEFFSSMSAEPAGMHYQGGGQMMGLSTEEVHDQENALGKLSSEQKKQLRKTGTFEVRSVFKEHEAGKFRPVLEPSPSR